MPCRICFASLAGSLAQAARKPWVKGFHAGSLVRPLLRMARYCNSAMQSAAFLALGHLMAYPAAQQVLCKVWNLIWTLNALQILLHCNPDTGLVLWAGMSSSVALYCKAVLLQLFAHETIITVYKHPVSLWGNITCQQWRACRMASIWRS